MNDDRCDFDIAAIKQNLNRHGRRMTTQRAAILAALRATTSHPTAEELRIQVQMRIPKISLGTIYRNLGVLVEEGYALRLSSPSGIHRFDGDVSEHHHAFCEVCGKVADVRLKPDPAMLRSAARMTNYNLRHRHIEFFGICPDCAE